MGLQIIKGSDPIDIGSVVVCIYGQPGIGKTSLGFTCEAPLCLDFDGGANRSAFRQDTVRIKAWPEIARLDPDDLKAYKTIVVDTGGRALDSLAAHLIQNEPKLSTSAGALTLQGYGALKAQFTNWLKMMRQLNKDVLILAHDSEDKSGDEVVVRPDMQGGSKQEIIRAADAIGYMFVSGKKVALDFSPSSRWIGKNPANIDPIQVPNFADEPNFGAESVISMVKEAISSHTKKQQEEIGELSEFRKAVKKADSTDDYNELLDKIEAIPDAQKTQAKRALWAAAKKAGLTYDKGLECFMPEGE